MTWMQKILGKSGKRLTARVKSSIEHTRLLSALEASKFWSGEDNENQQELSAQIHRHGVEALFSSKRIIPLDAENLAESGIIDALFDIGPYLRSRGVHINNLSSVTSEDGSSYAVEVNGIRYVAYSSEDTGENHWGLALETFVRLNGRLTALHSKP